MGIFNKEDKNSNTGIINILDDDPDIKAIEERLAFQK